MTITMNTKLEGLSLTTTRSNRNKSGGSTSATFTVDFSGCTVSDVLNWALSTRVISGQRVWEKFSADEILTKVNGQTLSALTIGKQPIDTDRQARAYTDKLMTMPLEQRKLEIAKQLEKLGLTIDDLDTEGDNNE